MEYSDKFKAAMVRKMTGPDAISANALSREAGVSQSALSRWLRQAGDPAVCTPEVDDQGAAGMVRTDKRPTDRTPEEKMNVVIEAQSLSEEELGAFLRKKGLYETHLKQWQEQILAALSQRSVGKPSENSAEQLRIRELEKEPDRKDKALAEAAALPVLRKKARMLFGGDGAEPIRKRNGK